MTKKLTLLALMFFIVNISLAQIETIYSNTTWNTNKTFDVLTIYEGAKLTINPGVKITIKHNGYISVRGELEANGVVFTSQTNTLSTMWHGIHTHGLGGDFDQVPLYNDNNESQPEIDLTNCTIQYSLYGVGNSLKRLTPGGDNSGGIVRIEECVFNSNFISVDFHPYLHLRGTQLAKDLSYVRNCTFNSGYPAHHAFINLDEVVGVKLLGNTYNGDSEHSLGVNSLYSSIIINSYYTNPAFNPVLISSSVFNNCLYGARITGSYSSIGKSIVRNSVFIHNDLGIVAVSSDNIEIYSNEITLKQDIDNSKICGIYLDKTSSFMVENNDVSANHYLGAFPKNTYGIVANDCGSVNNKIYRNIVDNCEYNIVGQGKNRGIKPQTGLQFICNDLSQTTSIGNDYTFYMAVLTDTAELPDQGVNDHQAGGIYNNSLGQFEYTSACMNTIPNRGLNSGDEFDFINENSSPSGGFDIFYTHQGGNTEPHYYTDYSPKAIGLIYNNIPGTTCPSQLPSLTPTPIGDIYDMIAVSYSAYQSAKQTFSNYENNGDHAFMLDLVNNLNSSNYMTVYYYLMNNHPSPDVLAIAVANDDLPSVMVRDVLVTNSYGIKYSNVENALDLRQNPLTQTQLNDIYTASETISQYEEYQFEISGTKARYDALITEAYNYHFNADEEVVLSSDLIEFYDGVNNYYSNISLMQYFFEINELNEAYESYNNAVNMEEISETERDDLSIIYNIFETVYSDFEGDFSQIEIGSEEYDILMSLSEESNSIVSGIATSILIKYFDLEYTPLLLSVDREKTSTERMAQNSKTSDVETFKVVPNPANDYIGLLLPEDFEYPANLEVYSMDGKLVMKKEIKFLNTIPIKNIENGIYQLKITDSNQSVYTQKLIVE